MLRSVLVGWVAGKLSVSCKFDQASDGREAGVAASRARKWTSCRSSSTKSLFNIRFDRVTLAEGLYTYDSSVSAEGIPAAIHGCLLAAPAVGRVAGFGANNALTKSRQVFERFIPVTPTRSSCLVPCT